MPKLIRTFLNLSKPTRTYLDLLKTIWTYPNLFEPIQTYLNITKQMQTKPSPSCGQKERNNKLRTQTQLLAICNIPTPNCRLQIYQEKRNWRETAGKYAFPCNCYQFA